MAEIKIYGVLVNDTKEGVVTRADQVLDSVQGKTQETLNREFLEFLDKKEDPTIAFDDFVTSTSDNAVKSKGIFQFISEAKDKLPYIGEDGYLYVWDLEKNMYVRYTDMRGPAGETGGTVHLIFDTTIMRYTSLGELVPKSPLRVRVVKQYGETGLDPYTDGCVKWWFNGIEDETKPDGWIGWAKPDDETHEEVNGIHSGSDMSEFFVSVNPDQHDQITFVLYIDKEGTKEFDRQNIFIIKDPAIYKFDLTNENSMVPMADEDGTVLDAFLEPTQAILYYGDSQVPFEEIEYAIESHDGLETATIDNEGRVTVSGWKSAWSNVAVTITATHKENTFKTVYNITRVSGIVIYRLSPTVTSIKRDTDRTLVVDEFFVNVNRVSSANKNSVTERVTSFENEGISVRYTYNNTDTVYVLSDPNTGIPVQGDNMPDIDGSVSEIDVYLVRSSQELDNLDVFIDHETIPILESGDDSYNIYLTNEASIVNCEADGTQVGQLQNTQAIFMKGTKNLSDLCAWDYIMTPSTGISPSPSWHKTTKGYLIVAGNTIAKEVEEVEIEIRATYDGNVYSKVYTIGKARRGGLGESGYKSTVFCRTNDTPRAPAASEGSYENPVPTGPVRDSDGSPITTADGKQIYWKDSIPSDSLGIIWATSRLFTTEGTGDSTWSTPAQMTDSKSVNIEFSPFVENPGYPDVADDGDKWFDPTNDSSMFTNQMVWMATQELSNGDPVMHADKNHPLKYTSWTIHRIKGEQGDAASSQYKSMVFCRLPAGTTPAAPSNTEGSFDSPVPTEMVKDTSGTSLGIYWSDGLPSGDYEYVVWMTSKIFWSDNTNEDDEWSIPQIMKDVPNKYDVQYSASLTKPISDPEIGDEWFDSEDPGVDLTTAVWMAQRWYTSEGWSAWDILKIKGERGEDGTGIGIKGSLDNVSQLDEIELKEVGDAYLIDGEIWIWDGYKWISGGQIKGEPGEDGKDGLNGISYFLHIKYSDDAGVSFTGNNGEMPGRWMGTAITNSEDNPDGVDPDEPGDYKWAQIRGESMFKSTVFCRNNETPSKPSGGSFEDPIPEGWYDGIPVGTGKIWSSTKLFSESGESDTEWSEPAQMSDTSTFDVEFSYNAIDDQPGTPEDDPDAWIDPDNPNFDGVKANWMATKVVSNGEDSGWSVILIRGEKGEPGERGESGSSAIVRSRGYWEDIPDGDWILSGTKHTEASGEIIEEFVDIVMAIDENTGKEYVFKCIKSHTKSASYDPITEVYSLDATTGTERSAHWMKATKYHFLATELLNAKDIIAETIQANKEEIIGQIAGEWDGDTSNGDEVVYTRVSTENGMIRFFYRYDQTEDWRLSVDIGYDFVSDSGVLTFYASDGKTPLYNLGPNGLSASVVNSPSYDDSNYYWSTGYYATPIYTGYGVFLEDIEDKSFYFDGEVPVLDLANHIGVHKFRPGETAGETKVNEKIDADFRVKLLEIGTFVVQMSQKFLVYNPITAEVIDYSGGTANYPSDTSPIISFGGNTIGYLGIAHPNLMYKEMRLSFDNNNYGILTSPVRKWNCVLESMTDLRDLQVPGSFGGDAIGSEVDVEINGFYGFIGEVSSSEGGNNSNAILKVREDQVYTNLLNSMVQNGSDWVTQTPDYVTISFDGESDLFESTDCNYVIADALSIVGMTIQNLINAQGLSNGIITSNAGGSVTINYGTQCAFQDAIYSIYPVCSAYLAKRILSALFTDDATSGAIENAKGGYIFPENKYFALEDTKLNLYEFEGGDSISSDILLGSNQNRETFSGLETNSSVKSGVFPKIDTGDRRAYLMIGSLSSQMGTINSSSSAVGYSNTYEISISSELINSGSDIRLNIKATPVNYFTAFMDYGIYRMPDKSGSGADKNYGYNVRYGLFKGTSGDLSNP